MSQPPHRTPRPPQHTGPPTTRPHLRQQKKKKKADTATHFATDLPVQRLFSQSDVITANGYSYTWAPPDDDYTNPTHRPTLDPTSTSATTAGSATSPTPAPATHFPAPMPTVVAGAFSPTDAAPTEAPTNAAPTVPHQTYGPTWGDSTFPPTLPEAGSTNTNTNTSNSDGNGASAGGGGRMCNGAGLFNSRGVCQCDAGHLGPHCQYSNATSCGNVGGVNGTGGCRCDVGHTGTSCQFSDAVTCGGGGTVNDQGGCHCDGDRSGADCRGSSSAADGSGGDSWTSTIVLGMLLLFVIVGVVVMCKRGGDDDDDDAAWKNATFTPAAYDTVAPENGVTYDTVAPGQLAQLGPYDTADQSVSNYENGGLAAPDNGLLAGSRPGALANRSDYHNSTAPGPQYENRDFGSISQYQTVRTLHNMSTGGTYVNQAFGFDDVPRDHDTGLGGSVEA